MAPASKAGGATLFRESRESDDHVNGESLEATGPLNKTEYDSGCGKHGLAKTSMGIFGGV